ncbi:hypothetical protein [Candidatus Mycoplasma haematohominis]|uniref:hypothetical protein n=1 Tax=Candidatus Mycoplasma haematohominis TaxID=1494318 RepID=UPI001C0A6F9A|nr:hypothetical protein [Candidatus Mycoplasma haemohominis]
MDLTKAAVGAGVVVLTVGGGYGVSTMFGKEPIHIQSATTDKFGEDFQFHFMDASDDKNDSWWQTRFEKLKSGDDTNSSNEFKKTAITGFEKLKEACKKVYTEKATKTDVHPNTDSDNTKANYEKDIWDFCSIDGFKPRTIKEAGEEDKNGYTDTKIGKTKSTLLVSIHDKGNEKFWERQARAFHKRKSSDGKQEVDGLGKRSQTGSSDFKELYEKQENERTVKALKDTCEKRYKEGSDTNNDKYTLMFCSLQGKQE